MAGLWNWENFLTRQRRTVSNRGAQARSRERGVLGDDLIFRHRAHETVEHDAHGYTGTGNRRLAMVDRRIDRDEIRVQHEGSITHRLAADLPRGAYHQIPSHAAGGDVGPPP